MSIMKRPVRFFNTTGPCDPNKHYMLPPADRLQNAQLHRYVNDELYWSLHAPRQTGKTTFLQCWTQELNATGNYAVCCVSVETGQGASLEMGVSAICDAIKETAEKNLLPVPDFKTDNPLQCLNSLLTDWAVKTAPKPLVVLFDEVDVLERDVMVSFLRQLRGGFATRGVGKFPISIALVGMKDLWEYIPDSKDGKPVNPGSPFNVKQDSVSIRNFTKENVAELFAQRTEETGQRIEPAALDYVWEQSQGQPWMVNNLFMRATLRLLGADNYETVTLDHVRQACEEMILARETHLESLAYRIKDERVRKVMEILLTGDSDPNLGESRGLEICQDLGLVVIEGGTPKIANPIYKEILARQMSYGTQLAISEPEFRWKKTDGTLDMDALLQEFQGFWQENSETWEEKSDYTEAFPHLLLMAFLQRITNGKGHIAREYALGRKRLDLAVEFGGSWNIIEIKLLRDKQTFEKVKTAGLKQVTNYRDIFSSSRRMKDGKKVPCYLLIFDRRSEDKKLPWEERITWSVEGDVTVVGC